MLVLTREIGETFSIGDDITVQILGISGNQVRFGFEAPRHIKIHRAEVFRRIVKTLSEPGGVPQSAAALEVQSNSSLGTS